MESKNHITVFSATGKIGAELLTLLSKTNVHTTAVTHNIQKAVELPFVQWVEADMLHKATLYAAMKNSRTVFLLSGSSMHLITEQNNVIEIAKELGVRHIVKLSSGAADINSSWHIARVHGEVEELLKASGMYWTMLRPNGIMQNWLGEMAKTVREERKLYEATGDGKRAHVDRRDIAEVAFKVLTEPEKHYNKTYFLTSDKAVNYKEVAIAIGNAINEQVEYVPITLEEARRQMEQAGMPHFLIDTFMAYDQAQRNGQAATVTNCVSTILGKPARTLEEFAKDYADRYK